MNGLVHWTKSNTSGWWPSWASWSKPCNKAVSEVAWSAARGAGRMTTRCRKPGHGRDLGIVRADIGGVHGPCRKAGPDGADDQGDPADQAQVLGRDPLGPATGGNDGDGADQRRKGGHGTNVSAEDGRTVNPRCRVGQLLAFGAPAGSQPLDSGWPFRQPTVPSGRGTERLLTWSLPPTMSSRVARSSLRRSSRSAPIRPVIANSSSARICRA